MKNCTNCVRTSFCIKTVFIDYWDNVVKFWLSNPNSHAICADRPLKGQSFYNHKGIRVNIEADQEPFFQNTIINRKLCPAHMPEPYWGNPCVNSIVIVNYNPGGGDDMGCHTYKFTNGNPTFLPFCPNTMIDFVHKSSYSSLALSFPIWKKNLSQTKLWLNSYGGRDWWKGKKEWAQHLVVGRAPGVCVEDVPPFAIELCGWHSPNWARLNWANAKNNNALKKTIEAHFVNPLLYAVEQSKSNLAVCIGAQFSHNILSIFIPCLQDVTQSVYKLLATNAKISYPAGSKNDSIAVEVNNKTRYYRVFDAYINGKHHVLLNTYAPGGNHHPAKHFWSFEKDLLRAIV